MKNKFINREEIIKAFEARTTEDDSDRVILEVLLDIRDLLNKKQTK